MEHTECSAEPHVAYYVSFSVSSCKLGSIIHNHNQGRQRVLQETARAVVLDIQALCVSLEFRQRAELGNRTSLREG